MKFVLENGILGWGLVMFVFTALIANWQQNRPLTAVSILVSACTWALAGAGFGWTIWTLSESKYKRFLDQETEVASGS